MLSERVRGPTLVLCVRARMPVWSRYVCLTGHRGAHLTTPAPCATQGLGAVCLPMSPASGTSPSFLHQQRCLLLSGAWDPNGPTASSRGIQGLPPGTTVSSGVCTQ